MALSAVLATAGCGHSAHGPAELVVGSRAGVEATLLADVYTGALRSYGFPARTEQAPNPLSELDSGAFVVVPTLTGRVLQAYQPGADARADAQVYKAMIGALPEGIAAGDYATAAEDKPALAVAAATSKDWGATDLGVLTKHCEGLIVGSIAGAVVPMQVGSCRLPGPREFPDDAALFAAVKAGEVTAAWTTTADPNVPTDLVVLTDGKPALVQAENVVPLYRRNELSTRQLQAVNEVAGVLDTAALVDMRRQVTTGADPQAVADAWLNEHPLGR
ncbi:glycine betaine ABC transporter substrate-binding protein [Candidatus Mycobacterium wuenschmannii]|uniref:Glycine betaine ABC transporter substrate-binding protein n=1 Tax=Candidatus Mycobacterium wuenschmannii TaxID=3027808 RepID=A0ABY8W3H1_9MYCO|nr:glycine betaine ABC transporter substrate-binding protein [Candidatus Mycobacterium wuenschmannii]WIM90287.1 glycine betaine ABC transporter substrate-binding protein [Candidatus Mycobacterium wuenschmannii]